MRQCWALPTSRSFNNEIGLPLTILRADQQTRYLVLEMGAARPGDITHLVRVGRPQIGMVLNVGPAHVLTMGGIDGVAQTKAEMVRDLPTAAGGGFALPYSAETVLDEFTMPAMVFEDGTMREAPAASGAIRYAFPEPIGEQEAFYTLHSEPATLPRTIDGVRDVRWRLALPRALTEGFALLAQLGLTDTEPIETSVGAVVPRELLLRLLSRLPSPDAVPQDVEAVDVIVEGTKDGRPATFTGTTIFRPTPEGIGAGTFGTAIPIAVCARWMAEGRVEPGVHPPENAFDAEAFLGALVDQGVEVSSRVEERYERTG